MSYSNRGGSHDSSCFKDSTLYQKLKSMSQQLFEKGFFILGDSAYSIDSFILTPYDQPHSKSPQDAFNFFHSSARITVECAFGEIDLRWGIFWKRLTMSLDNACTVIEGAMRLHNFLVDCRESQIDDSHCERELFQENVRDVNAQTLQVGSDLGRPGGRTTDSDRETRTQGLSLRNHLTNALAQHDMHRPQRNEWHTDINTHVQRF